MAEKEEYEMPNIVRRLLVKETEVLAIRLQPYSVVTQIRDLFSRNRGGNWSSPDSIQHPRASCPVGTSAGSMLFPLP